MDKLKELLAKLEGLEAEFTTMVSEYNDAAGVDDDDETKRGAWTAEQIEASDAKMAELKEAREAYDAEKKRIEDEAERAENVRKQADEWIANINKRTSESQSTHRSADSHTRPNASDSDKVPGEDALENLVFWMRNDGVLPSGQYSPHFDLILPYKDPLTGKMESPEDAYKRSFTTGNAAAMVGGAIAEQLVQAMYDNDPVRSAGATVYRRPDGRDYKIASLFRGPEVPIVAEGADSAEHTPGRGGVTISPVRRRAWLDVTEEMLEDNGVNLIAQLPTYMRDAVFAAFGAVHTTKMNAAGLVSGNNTDIRASGSGFTYNDIDLEAMNALYAGVEKPYRRTAMLMCNTQAALQIGSIQTGSANASPLAFPLQYADGNIVSAGPFRVVINDEMAAVPAANAIAAIYADFRYFHIVDVRNIRISRDEYSAAQQGEMRFWFSMRSGAEWHSPNNFGIHALKW